MSGNMESGDSFYDEINLACERFEAEWQAGAEPQIEQYIAAAPEQARPDLASELLKLDIYYRRERGDTIGPEDYTPRFPEHASLIDTLLAVRSSANSSTKLTHAGGYRIQGLIGSGGMGEVYRADDSDFKRPLAIKILRKEYKNRPEMVARFLEEAKITGQLEHPGVPPAHLIGHLEDGRPFLSMKLIEGRTLADLLAERKDPTDGLPRFLTIFEHICQTVAYAHSRRIIHRDLKPANVMVGAFGEVQVMDWGLAKVLTTEERTPDPSDNGDRITPGSVDQETVAAGTQLGRPMGTWAYMPPEQACGEWDQVDERSDVFSLGATLCEMLTWEPAYLGEKLREQAEKANLADAYSRLNACGADPELIALAKKCLHAEMDLRPRDARAVSCVVAAYQTEVQERLRKAELERAAAEARAQEERRTAVAERRALKRTVWLAAASVLLVAGAGSGAWWYQHEQAAREAARLVRQGDTERDVTAALTRVDGYLQQGWKEMDYPEHWRMMVGLAETAMRSAEGLLVAGEPTNELTERVQASRAAVNEAARESKLRAELDGIRLDMADVRRRHQLSGFAARYASLLRASGIDETSPDGTARVLRGSRQREALLAALEDWAWVTPDPAQRKALYTLLKSVEPDSAGFSAQWSQAWEQSDKIALSQLSQKAHVEKLPPVKLLNMAKDLGKAGLFSEAARLLRLGQGYHPDNFWLNHDLGLLLGVLKPPHQEEAVRFLTAAVALRSDSVSAYINLGNALDSIKDFEGAIRCYRAAIQLDPKVMLAHYNLGKTLQNTRDFQQAIQCFRTAIKIDPNDAWSLAELGNMLQAQGELQEAIAYHKRAVDLEPKNALFQLNMGNAFNVHGDLDDAIRCFSAALELDPMYVKAHTNLGAALHAKGDVEGAIRCMRTATELDPDEPLPHINLGLLHRQQGRFIQALESVKRGHELGIKQLGWSYPSAQLLRETERLAELDARLPRILDGRDKPGSLGEQLMLAKICQECKKLYVAAARFYSDAFGANANLAEDLRSQARYNAGCAAALAGCGKGEDAYILNDQERTRLRKQALDWLRADLAAWTKLADDAKE
jgi:serine/threonine-protein kinase